MPSPASLSPSSLHLSQTSPSQGSTLGLQGPPGVHSRGYHRLPFLCRQVCPCVVCHRQQLKAFRHGPSSLELTGKEEVLIFTITFMLSTWWIKNPFLKNKIIDVCLIFLNSFFPLTALQILFCSCFTYKEQSSLLGSLLNSHAVALKYLMPALTHFYIGTNLSCSVNNVRPETCPQKLNRLARARNFTINSVRS